MKKHLPSSSQAKEKAKQLRAKMAAGGLPISHAKSLELIAQQHGFRDWNTIVAAIGNTPPTGWTVGETVTGRYLTQGFSARIVSISEVTPGWFRLELQLDEPIDVVTFDSFSNFRSRIHGIVGPKGHSMERTSDGKPHLQIDLC